MEFINEHGFLILIILSALVIFLAIVIYVNTFRLKKQLVTNKIYFKAILNHNAQTNTDDIEIIALNKSLVDVSIQSLGIINGIKYFDFIKEYYAAENISGQRAVISQRSSIKLALPINLIEDTIIPASLIKTLNKVRVYAIDKAGNLSKGNARSIKKVLIKKNKQIVNEKKLAQKNEFLESYNTKLENKEKIALKDKLKKLLYKMF